MDKTIENQKAVQKPETLKFGTIFDAKIINNAFIIKEKRPRVIIVSGRATNLTRGFIKIFITPKTTAKTTDPKSVTVTPGTI